MKDTSKILIIGHIENSRGEFLMRKKFPGSPPYIETMYHFGCEWKSGENPENTFSDFIKSYIGISIHPTVRLHWVTETKIDHDGIKKSFLYLYMKFHYLSGDISIPQELERVEWISPGSVGMLDIVPPSRDFLKILNVS